MIAYDTPTAKPGRIRFLVEGKCPLLSHNPASMHAAPQTKKGGAFPSPAEEAEAGTYRLEDGTCATKGEGFRAALLAASTNFKVPRKRYSFQRVLEHVAVVEDLVPLTRADGKPISDYVIDARRAIIQGNGIIRHRPCYPEWRTMFTLEYDPLLITDPKIIVDIMADAGNLKGIGDYRPRFGRFIVLGYWVE
jgi:hypothetical protein